MKRVLFVVVAALVLLYFFLPSPIPGSANESDVCSGGKDQGKGGHCYCNAFCITHDVLWALLQILAQSLTSLTPWPHLLPLQLLLQP